MDAAHTAKPEAFDPPKFSTSVRDSSNQLKEYPARLYWRPEAIVARISHTIPQLTFFAPGRASALTTPIRISVGSARSLKHVPVAMTALWSRAFRTPGTFKCKSCAANVSPVARHASTTGLRGGCAFGTPTSTFVYTTVSAAELATDTKAKQFQSGQGDHAPEPIQEALRALQRPSRRTHNGAAPERNSLRHEEGGPSDLHWNDAFEAAGMDMIHDTVLDKRQEQLDAALFPEVLWDLLIPDARLDGPSLLDWPASSGPDLSSRNLPPQSLWSLESVRLRALRNRVTRKKLVLQELSVCALVYELLGRFNSSMFADDDLVPLSPHIGNVVHLTFHEMLKVQSQLSADKRALESTKLEDWPEDVMSIRVGTKIEAEPTYFQDVDGDFHLIAHQLNGAIKNLFEEYHDKRKEPQHIALATAKICHNLLVSSAAPNLQTFNILLTGFRKWEQPHLVSKVINALYDCKIRPNEITCATILNHYAETQQPERFSKFIALMRGADDALMLARPNVTVNEASQGRLVRISETKVLQKVYPTPMVFDALMHGVLIFAGFDRALEIYFEMKDDGWGLSIVGLSRFLDDCLHRADWEGGLIVWDEIASITGRIQPDLLARAYAQFLSLCSVTQRPAAFNSVLNDVVKQGYSRKTILTMYKDIRNAIRPKQGYYAPAFTADNLLIAVSDYMKTDEDTEAEAAPFFEELDADLTEGQLSLQQQGTAEHVDPWTAWMEHELGGPKQDEVMEADPSLAGHGFSEGTPQPQAQGNAGTATDVDPWAIWMEHELRERVQDKTPPLDDSEPIPKRRKDP